MGCEQRTTTPAAPSPATAPATAASAIAPATTQSTSRPVASFMKINGRLTMFPPARLKIEDDGQRLTAMLFSDDPKEALKDDYTGTSFYLQMSLDVPDVKDLPLATWTHKARSAEREDTPFGIYLNGRKIQLQPDNVTATFTAPDELDITMVHLTGQFLLWNNKDATGLPQTAVLSADLPVKVETDSAHRP